MKKPTLAIAALLTGAFMIPAIAVPAVLAVPEVESHLEVLGAGLAQDCDGGNQIWEIATQITVHNTSAESVTFEWTGFWAQFSTPTDPHQVQNDVEVVDANGFEPGVVLGPDETAVFGPVVRVALPCDARSASLYGQIKLVGRDKIFGCSDYFIEDGTTVPVTPTGIVGIAVVLGVAACLTGRLGVRPRWVFSPSASHMKRSGGDRRTAGRTR